MKSQNNILIYTFENHKVRTVLINGEPWFMASDVCKCLEFTNPSMAILNLDADEKQKLNPKFNLGLQNKEQPWVINESGLYTLILRSRNAIKKGTVQHKFRKWVTSEVLPSIRKTGNYQTEDQQKLLEEQACDLQCVAHNVWAIKGNLEYLLNHFTKTTIYDFKKEIKSSVYYLSVCENKLRKYGHTSSNIKEIYKIKVI